MRRSTQPGIPPPIPNGFLFTDTFATSGEFSGTLTVPSTQAVGQPSTTPTSLTVAENGSAAPIDITTPTDAAFDTSDLAVTVTGLPTDGSVDLSDGVTPVTLDEALTVSQLTGLTFTPTPDASDEFLDLHLFRH